MSEGGFQRSKYLTNLGTIHAIKVQPETLQLIIDGQINAPPAGDIDRETTAWATGSRKRNGVTARKIGITWVTAPPTGYQVNEIIYIPVMTPTSFNQYLVGQTGSYLGADVEVVGRIEEQIR